MTKYKCIYNGNDPDKGVCTFHSQGLCNNSDYCPNQQITKWSNFKNTISNLFKLIFKK